MKVTREQIEGLIESEKTFVDGTLTLVVLTLTNGFKVVGQSACVDINEFDAGLGYKIAYDNAFDKVWKLEGYLLAERLSGGNRVI